jgi:asparagine synthetase B (glutamine-hydrolysing)
MSDFLFSTRPAPPGVLRAALERYLGPVSAVATEYHGAWGSLAVVMAEHDRSVVVEDDHSLSVLIGEPLLRTAGRLSGSAAEASSRPAAHRLLLEPGAIEWQRRLDGPFAALVVDTRRGTGRVLTDLFAWIPVFSAPLSGSDAGLLLGTHVDAVAEAAGRRGDIDPVSAAELLAFFTVTFPHTLFAAVEQVGPATERAFGGGGWSAPGRVYWEPVERVGFDSRSEAAAELREGLIEDVRAACAGQSTVGALLSGGEDSRAVLGALPPGVDVRAFTFAPSDNREVRTARRVARAYGASHTFALRDSTHDLRHFEQVSALVSSHNMFVDAHAYALHDSLGLARLPVVLGGLSSDALLKGDNVSLRAQKALRRGRRPPTRRWRAEPLPGLEPELLAAAEERREGFRSRLAELRPESADEWTRIYPFTMRKYAANMHGNRRLFRAHEPYMSSRVVELAAAVPQAWKIDRRLFLEAMRPLLARSWYVPHTRNRFPFLPRSANLVARPVLGTIRRAREALTATLGWNQESWPIWAELVETAEMRERSTRYPLPGSRVGAALSYAPEELSRQAAGWPPLKRLMLLHLAHLTSPHGLG